MSCKNTGAEMVEVFVDDICVASIHSLDIEATGDQKGKQLAGIEVFPFREADCIHLVNGDYPITLRLPERKR